MIGGKKRIRWTCADISSSISLYASGARAYRYMHRKGHPLPAPSTFMKWASKLHFSSGILKVTLNILKELHFDKEQKLCVLSFDEMKVREVFEYDRPSDTTTKPYKYVLVALIRGLLERWNQPIFYDFDCPMTKSLLLEIIRQLGHIGFTVVAVTSDLGASNACLRRELGINENVQHFPHPCDDTEKVFMFADVPHLIKLLRNHFLDKGFSFEGKILTPAPVRELLTLQTSDLKICPKISSKHLDVIRAGRQKVKLAVHLFSHSVSSAIRRCKSSELLDSPNSVELANVIKIANDWFDIFNSKVAVLDTRVTHQAFGLHLEEQITVLANMTKVMTDLRVYGKRSLLLFQKAIIGDNNALIEMFSYMKEKQNISYLLTNRLNPDVLENFFGVIRSKRGLHDHPTPIEFKYRLRSGILGNF